MLMSTANSDLSNNPHASQHTFLQQSRSTSQASVRNLEQRSQNAGDESPRPSIEPSRASSDNVVKVFTSLPTVFDFADFASARGNVSGHSLTFINLIQRVRHDIAELSRLYETHAVTEFLKTWPEKKVWIDNILLDIQRALNNIGADVESVRAPGDDGGPDSLRCKFEWVLSHQEKFLNKQQYLTTCHQSLMGAIEVLYTAEMSYAEHDEDEYVIERPHSGPRLRLSLKNNSLPSILVSEVEGNDVEMASNLPVELPGSTPEDLPDPENWDLYAPPRRQRSLSASAVPTSPRPPDMPAVAVSAQVKLGRVYVAYNPRFSTLGAKPPVIDDIVATSTTAKDLAKEDERAANAPEVISVLPSEVVASPVTEPTLTYQVVTLNTDKPRCTSQAISPISANPPSVNSSKSGDGTLGQENGQKQGKRLITAWPARSSSKVPPKDSSPHKKTFNKIKPLPLYTRSRSSDAARRPRALSDQLRSLEDKARASFDSKPKLKPTEEEKPTEIYNTASSVRLSTISPLPASTNGIRLKEVNVKKPPTKSHTMPLPMELPGLSTTGSLMDELSRWVLPPGARTSYHSLDTNGSLEMSTPATSADGSPIQNTKETEVTATVTGATASPEALKSPQLPSGYRLFPTTPTTPGLPTRAPPPLPKDLLPRIEKSKSPGPSDRTASRPLSPEAPPPALPPRPRLDITEPSDEKTGKAGKPIKANAIPSERTASRPLSPEGPPPALPPRPRLEITEPSEEKPPRLPSRPTPQRSLSPSSPSISLESPLPSPQGPLPALPPRRLSPQASSSSLSNDEGTVSVAKKLQHGPQTRQTRRNTSNTRQPSPQIPDDPYTRSTTPQQQPQQQSPSEKALPVPPQLRALSEQLKQPEPTPVPESTKPRSKVDITMEAHPGTLVNVVPSFPAAAPAGEPNSPPPQATEVMELPPIEISHSHPVIAPANAAEQCESRITAQTKRRRAQARRMQAAVADD